MVNAAFIQQLKQSNISKDGALTSQRTKELWQGASSDAKQTVCELSGSAKATVYRIFKTGGISAKLALAVAQVLGINPRYLTGEAEEPGVYDEADVTNFLSRLGYDKLLVEQEKAVRRAVREAARLKKEAEAAAAEAPAEPVSAEAACAPASKEVPSNEIVTNEDILVLVHALEIRAKAGNPEARELLRQIKLLLLGC